MPNSLYNCDLNTNNVVWFTIQLNDNRFDSIIIENRSNIREVYMGLLTKIAIAAYVRHQLSSDEDNVVKTAKNNAEKAINGAIDKKEQKEATIESLKQLFCLIVWIF